MTKKLKKKTEEDKDAIDLSKVVCYDCGKKIEFKGDEIANGKMLIYDTKDGKIAVFKCTECAEKHPELTDYQDCEVYSRIVGYIRPVQKWHPGKVEEFKDRVEFEVPKNLD